MEDAEVAVKILCIRLIVELPLLEIALRPDILNLMHTLYIRKVLSLEIPLNHTSIDEITLPTIDQIRTWSVVPFLGVEDSGYGILTLRGQV